MPDGLAAYFGSVDKSPIVTVEVGYFKNAAGDLDNRAVPARNCSIGSVRTHLVGRIPAHKQRATRCGPKCSLQRTGNRQQPRVAHVEPPVVQFKPKVPEKHLLNGRRPLPEPTGSV